MRTRFNRRPAGRLVVILATGLVLLAFLGGCGSGSETYNPALVGGGPAPTFSLTATPASVTIAQGQTATYTVTLTSANGFNSVVTPSVTGLPAGAVATFDPTTVTPTANGSQTTLTITTTGGQNPTPTGTSNLSVSATGDGITQQVGVSLVITQSAPGNGGLQGTIQ